MDVKTLQPLSYHGCLQFIKSFFFNGPQNSSNHQQSSLSMQLHTELLNKNIEFNKHSIKTNSLTLHVSMTNLV